MMSEKCCHNNNNNNSDNQLISHRIDGGNKEVRIVKTNFFH